MFVARDVGNTDAIQIVDRRAQANRVGDIPRAGFKSLRRRLIEGLLEGHILNHVSPALPRRHLIQHFGLPINYTDAGRRKDLVPGEDIEVAVDGLHIDAHMRDRLRPIHQHASAVAMRCFDHFFHRHNRTQRIRDVRD